MTIRRLAEVCPPGPPRRSGEPWTDEDYEDLVRLCREGLDLPALSERLGRSPLPVRDRAKRMLPLDQRGVPGDRVLTQLRKNLLDDPDYDWGHHLAATLPARPIVNHVLPAPRYAGVPGLEDDELLTTAESLARQHHPDEEGHLAHALAHEVCRRGLVDDLRHATALRAQQRIDRFLERASSTYRPTDCWAMPGPDLPAGAGSQGWEHDEPPW